MEKLSKKHGLDYGTYAVSCVHHSSLCTDQEVKGYPRVKLFQAGETFGKFLNVWELHPAEMLRELSVDFNLSEEEESFSVEQKKEKQGMETNQDGKLDFLPRSKTDIYNDAQLSFDFAMKNAIFTDRKRLSEEKEKALKEWLQLMKAALPPGWSLQTLVSDLYENIESIAKSEKNLLKIVKKHPPKKKSWSHSCRKGDGMAGYTCGLWELFHIVSIGVVEWNSMVVGDDDWPFYRPEESAETLRNYIENFFGCEVCRLNFMHAFDSCAFQRCDRLTKYVGELEDWKELPMWLFEMHNGVNVRLMREQAEENHRVPTREDEIAVQWPSTSECPLCWHADGRWDPDKVYTFLRLTYWPDDETSASARRSLFVEELEEEDDYEEEEGSPRIFLLVIFGSLIITGGSWYRKRLLLARTGYHKKVDDSAV